MDSKWIGRCTNKCLSVISLDTDRAYHVASQIWMQYNSHSHSLPCFSCFWSQKVKTKCCTARSSCSKDDYNCEEVSHRTPNLETLALIIYPSHVSSCVGKFLVLITTQAEGCQDSPCDGKFLHSDVQVYTADVCMCKIRAASFCPVPSYHRRTCVPKTMHFVSRHTRQHQPVIINRYRHLWLRTGSCDESWMKNTANTYIWINVTQLPKQCLH